MYHVYTFFIIAIIHMRRSEQDQKVALMSAFYLGFVLTPFFYIYFIRDVCIEKLTLPTLALQGTLKDHLQRGIQSKCLAITTLYVVLSESKQAVSHSYLIGIKSNEQNGNKAKDYR